MHPPCFHLAKLSTQQAEAPELKDLRALQTCDGWVASERVTQVRIGDLSQG